MMNIKSKNDEFTLFNQLSDEWWNDNGKFKILHQIKSHRMTYILDQIGNRDIKNFKILDVGCGGGIICEPLARLGAKVTGIDFAPNNINAAKIHSKKNKLKINYIHKDVEKSKLDGKFDLILMFEVLEHLDDWKKTIKKIKKNLNKNGIIIISTINRNLLSKLFAISIAENILKWIPKGTHDYNKLIKPEELKNFVGCFLTGTAAEVTPVSCIAENKFKVCELIIDLNESYQSFVKKKKTAA